MLGDIEERKSSGRMSVCVEVAQKIGRCAALRELED